MTSAGGGVARAGSPLAAWIDGLRRTARAPLVLASTWGLVAAVALPAAFAVGWAIRDHLGSSTIAERTVSRLDPAWVEEFAASASGVSATFGPSVVGFAGVLVNLGGAADAIPLHPALAALVVVWLLLWTVALGGIVDRYARNRAVGREAFAAAVGRHALPLVRLAFLALAGHVALFWVHSRVFGDLWPWLTGDLISERTAAAWRVLLYALVFTPIILWHLVVDYARVRLVIEDRRSAMGALLAALRFVRRRPVRVLVLFLLGTTLFVLVLAAYALADVGGVPLSPLGAVIAGQLYLLARLFTKLSAIAGEVAFFQAELAHAHYVAAPLPSPAESPMAEAIGRRA